MSQKEDAIIALGNLDAKTTNNFFFLNLLLHISQLKIPWEEGILNCLFKIISIAVLENSGLI